MLILPQQSKTIQKEVNYMGVFFFILGMIICPEVTISFTILIFLAGIFLAEDGSAVSSDDGCDDFEEPSTSEKLLGIGAICWGASLINNAYQKEQENR